MGETVDIRLWGKNDIPISDESLKLLMRMHALKMQPFNEVSIEDGRKQFKQMYLACAKPRSFSGKVTNMNVPSPEVKEGINIKVLVPKVAPEDPCIMVYCHGGGQLYGDNDDYISMYKALSKACKCIIVAVDYRLAPEHEFPAGMNDCVEVTRWTLQNKTTIGGTDKSPVGVAGDSAGGQSAAHVALTVKDLNFQILVYPGVDMTISSPSFDEFHDGPFGTKALCEWIANQLLPEGASREDPRWSPIFNTELSILPPTLIILAEVDPIRDDGRRYSTRLKEAGVDTTLLEIKSTIHNFFSLPNIFIDASKEAYTAVAEFLTKIKEKQAKS